MDIKNDGRVLYISSVDISVGNGPGVNEREFILAVYSALGSCSHFLIPKPVNGISDIPKETFTFTYPHRKHNPIYFPFHVVSQIYKANKLLSQQKYDLIVFRLDLMPIAPLIITRIHKIPYALKTLGQGFINTLREKWGVLGKLLYKANLFLAKKIVNGAVLADSVSLAQVDFLNKLFNTRSNNIVWIDNAVNTDRFFPSSSSKAKEDLGLSKFDPIVGYVGTRPWERGGMQLIETAPCLLEKYPDLGILILGDGVGLENMKKKSREIGIEDHCIFTGSVSFDKVPSYVSALDIGVSINLVNSRFASSELKVRQYLASGKPVILSPGSNNFVLENDFGSVVPPKDLNAITEAINKWLSMTDREREEFSQRAAKYMQEHKSIDAAISERFKLWSEKLAENHYNNK